MSLNAPKVEDPEESRESDVFTLYGGKSSFRAAMAWTHPSSPNLAASRGQSGGDDDDDENEDDYADRDD